MTQPSSSDETRIARRDRFAECGDVMCEIRSAKELRQFYSAMGKAAMWHKKANGETMHLAPLGYRNVKKDGRSTIEPDPDVYPLVQEAKKLRRKGWSIRKICKHMAKRGLRSKRGNVICPGAMQRALREENVRAADSVEY